VFRCGSGQLNPNPMKILFVSVNASRAWWLNSRPQPLALNPPHGAATFEDGEHVDPDGACADGRRGAVRGREIPGPYERGQPVVGVVGAGGQVVGVVVGQHGQYRPEDLFPGDGHVVGDAAEHGRPVEVAGRQGSVGRAPPVTTSVTISTPVLTSRSTLSRCSLDSRRASSSACSSIRSAIRHRILARCPPGRRAQAPSSNTARAWATAASTSAGPASATWAITSSDAGSRTSRTVPAVAGTDVSPISGLSCSLVAVMLAPSSASRGHMPSVRRQVCIGRRRGFLPVAELFMSLRALFPVETSGGMRLCVL